MELITIDSKLVDKLVSDFTKKLSNEQGIRFLTHLKFAFGNNRAVPIEEIPGGMMCTPCSISGKTVTTITRVTEFLEKFNALVDEFNNSTGVAKEVALSNQQKLMKKTAKAVSTQSYGYKSKDSDLVICNEVLLALNHILTTQGDKLISPKSTEFKNRSTFTIGDGFTEKLKMVEVVKVPIKKGKRY